LGSTWRRAAVDEGLRHDPDEREAGPEPGARLADEAHHAAVRSAVDDGAAATLDEAREPVAEERPQRVGGSVVHALRAADEHDGERPGAQPEKLGREARVVVLVEAHGRHVAAVRDGHDERLCHGSNLRDRHRSPPDARRPPDSTAPALPISSAPAPAFGESALRSGTPER
jgi:hypothetical protein